MPTITPPEAVRPTLSKLASMSSEQFDEILHALKEGDTNTKLTSSVLISGSEASTEIESVTLCAESLEIGRLRWGLPRHEFAAGIVSYVDRATKSAYEPQQSSEFARRLVAIMSVPALAYAAKAAFLAVEHEHVVQDLNILTDLRPVFKDEDFDSAPEAFVLTHSLKLEYVDANGHNKTLFTCLDDGDLRKLAKVCERAQKKGKNLESIGGESIRIVRINSK